MPIQTSFVMAVLNRAQLLERTLQGYRPYAPYHGVELVVADYGSTDNVKKVLECANGIFERIRYLVLDRSKSNIPINPKYNNPSVALNVAIRRAQGPMLIMSPPECYPLNENIRAAQEITGTGTLKACVFGRAMAMTHQSDEGVIGRDGWFPRSEYELHSRLNNRVAYYSSARPEFAWSKYGPVLRPVPFFMAFRKTDHETVNGFDEEYARGYSGEDSDYTSRLKLSGVEHVWNDRCTVLHQWHPTIELGGDAKLPPPGRTRATPSSTKEGFRVNMDHEPGSLGMIAAEEEF